MHVRFVAYPADMGNDQDQDSRDRELALTRGGVDRVPWGSTERDEMDILSRYFTYDESTGTFLGYVAENEE